MANTKYPFPIYTRLGKNPPASHLHASRKEQIPPSPLNPSWLTHPSPLRQSFHLTLNLTHPSPLRQSFHLTFRLRYRTDHPNQKWNPQSQDRTKNNATPSSHLPISLVRGCSFSHVKVNSSTGSTSHVRLPSGF